jgi:shikimate dehydrogenase
LDELPPEERQAPPPAAQERIPEPELGGPPGPEPTRYGDWERRGRCIDF